MSSYTSNSLPELSNMQAIASRISVTLNSFINLLQNLKEFKEYGPDKIPNCLLKECANEIAPLLTLLLRKKYVIATVGKWQHYNFIKVFVIIHKNYYFYCNGTGYKSEGIPACSWEMPTSCLHKDVAKR